MTAFITKSTQLPSKMASATEDSPPSTYPARQCRLCFEECEATVELPPAGSASQNARVRYYSAEDPSLGQLISPCNCTGSARFIHEGCLDTWRRNAAQKKHFWECNVCHYQYQFSRLGWARLLENPAGHFAITAMVALLLVFVFGYIADPIINLYIDPYSATSSSRLWTPVNVSDTGEEASWLQHFYKGLASLGVLSFARVLFMANPWHWYSLRNSGLAHGTTRPSATGQERIANISWVVLVVGVMTFLYTLFKGMNSLTRWFLEKAAFHIKEVPHDDDEIRPGQQSQSCANTSSGSRQTSHHEPQTHVTVEKAAEKAPSNEGSSTATTPLAEALAKEDSATQNAVPIIPGAFDAPGWSFS
jgi:RING-variant domain